MLTKEERKTLRKTPINEYLQELTYRQNCRLDNKNCDKRIDTSVCRYGKRNKYGHMVCEPIPGVEEEWEDNHASTYDNWEGNKYELISPLTTLGLRKKGKTKPKTRKTAKCSCKKRK